MNTRSLGALRAPTSSWGPFGPRLRPSRPSGAQAARPTQVTHLSPKKIWQFSGNMEVRWWEILFEALEKSIWPSLRNTARTEVIRIFCDEDRQRTEELGILVSWCWFGNTLLDISVLYQAMKLSESQTPPSDLPSFARFFHIDVSSISMTLRNSGKVTA